jgi:hypothetical protein
MSMRIMKIGFPVLLAVISFATSAPTNAQQTAPTTQQAVNTVVEKCIRQVQALYPAQDDSRMADRTAVYKACVANSGTIPGTTGSGAAGSR